MNTNQRTMMLFLCISTALLQITEITCLKVQRISHILPFTRPLFQDTREQPSARLAYGVCDSNDMAYNRDCSLVIESDEPRESIDHLYFCDINISSSMRIDDINYVYALDENIIIIQWESYYRRFAIVHFQDCKVVYPMLNDEVKISFDSIRAHFNGTFDVIVQDKREKSPCIRGHWCRMIFDVNGNVVEQPRNWIKEGNDIIDIVHSPDGSRLVVDMDYSRKDKYIRVYKAYDNGTINGLENFTVGNLFASSKKITVSNTYQLVTICALNNSNLTCAQFDYNGVLKLKTHFKPLNFSDLHSAKVFNRKNGGFVLLTLNCLNSENVTECHLADEQYFTIRIFDAATRITKSLTMKQLKCGNEFNLDNIHFVDNVNENFSLSYMCDHREEDGGVSVEVYAFTKKDFEV